MPQEPKKHVSHWIAWSVIALAVGLVGFGTWWYYDEIATIYDSTITVTIKPTKKTTTPAATTKTSDTSPTADWKTYTNTKYSFSLKYPKNFYLNDWIWDKIAGKKVSVQDFVFIGKKPLAQDAYLSESDFPQPYFLISVAPEVFTDLKNVEPNATNSDITFAGESAVKSIRTTPSVFDGTYSTSISFNHDSKGYAVSWENSDAKGTHDTEIDQIFSTFQFTK